MDILATLLCFGAGVLGLLGGYFVGYRSGLVAGELAAIKSMRRRDRDGSNSASRRGGGEDQR